MNKLILKNIIFKLILNIFNICIPLIVSPYILRILGAENIGKINYAESIYTYFFAFASLGLYQYGIREVAKYRHDKTKLSKFFSECFIITLISSLVILGLYFFSIIYISNLNKIKSILMIYSINIFSNIFYVEWANEGFENYKFITIKTIIIRLMYVLGIFILVKSKDDYLIYVILNTLFILFNNFISFIFIKKNIGFTFKGIFIKKHFKYLIASLIISSYGLFFYQLDKLILGKNTNDFNVSMYSVSNMIMFMILTLLQTILTVTIPRLTNFLSNNKEKYNDLLNKLYKFYCIVSIPVSIGVIILSKEILIIYGGQEYIGANITLKLFAVFLIIINIEAFIRNQILYVNNKDKMISIFLILAGVVNLILNLIFINYETFTVELIVFTSIISVLVLLILEYIYIKINLDIKFYIISKDIIKYFISCLVFFPIYMFVTLIVKSFIFKIVLIIVICMLAYTMMLYWLKESLVNDLIYKNIKRH